MVVVDCPTEEELCAFLEGCAAASELDAIERHLCDCPACRQIVAALGATHPRDGLEVVQPKVDDLVDGQYRIVRQIGRGGMGAVYLAHDMRLDRGVALKFCTTASVATAQRVEREALALARLTHPNVVVVYQVGEWRGQVYIAMEHVPGGNAREWMRARPRTWGEIVALYVAAGEGLAAAHAAGFVHRDFKPDNILVGTDGRPRVADFGLVGAGATSSEDGQPAPVPLASLTHTNSIVGTHGYMAPEQFTCGTVDARADQFAFCVSLWETLFGARPFVSATFADMAEEIASGRPELPKRQAVPHRIVAALRRGLSATPDRRWHALPDLLNELRRRRRVPRFAIAGLGVGAVLATTIALAASRSSSEHLEVVTACAPAPAGAGDIYVEATARTDAGVGTRACPYKTITQALADARTQPRVIHVAAGTYDVTLGERFPLVVRGDVHLVGAGAGTTHVVGSGHFDPHGTTISRAVTEEATFIIGDDHASSELASLSLAPGGDVTNHRGYGLICDRGNLGALGSETVQPPPSVVARELDIGPGYNNGIAAGATVGGTGCNLRMEHTTVHDANIGVWAVGCGMVEEPTSRRSAVGLDIVSSAFTDIRYPAKDNHSGAAVVVWDCTRWLTVRDSRIWNSDIGIACVNHFTATTQTTIEKTSFHDLHQGIAFGLAASIDRLVGNSFVAITGGPAALVANRGVAVTLDSGTEEDVYPEIKLARDNTFLDNDVGIELRGHQPVLGTIDFGRPDDPGHNTIRCNSTVDGSAVPGHDLVVRAPLARSAHISFAGNTWDHAPPSAGGKVNGADIDVAPGDRAAVNTSGAVVGREACSMRSR